MTAEFKACMLSPCMLWGYLRLDAIMFVQFPEARSSCQQIVEVTTTSAKKQNLTAYNR